MASIFIESLYLKSKTNKACKSSKVHQGSEWSLPPVTLKAWQALEYQTLSNPHWWNWEQSPQISPNNNVLTLSLSNL